MSLETMKYVKTMSSAGARDVVEVSPLGSGLLMLTSVGGAVSPTACRKGVREMSRTPSRE